jgi:hypothetical protein
MKRRKLFSAIFPVLGGLLILCTSQAGAQGVFDESLLKNFNYRSLGPYRVGSMIMDFAVPESPAKAHLYTFYVGTRNGGLWKTTNNGTTFEPVFDGQGRLTIGDVSLAPSNPKSFGWGPRNLNA